MLSLESLMPSSFHLKHVPLRILAPGACVDLAKSKLENENVSEETERSLIELFHLFKCIQWGLMGEKALWHTSLKGLILSAQAAPFSLPDKKVNTESRETAERFHF